jgi:hypothetical protein
VTTIQTEDRVGVQPEIGELVTAAKELTWGWGKAAQFLADCLADIPSLATGTTVYHYGYVLIYLSPEENPLPLLADIARRGVKAGAKVEKEYDAAYGKVKLHFGPIYVQAYTERSEVCERVVLGTREVVEEVKDPVALAAVPTITQTRTEDIIRWECKPLLVGEQNSEVSA